MAVKKDTKDNPHGQKERAREKASRANAGIVAKLDIHRPSVEAKGKERARKEHTASTKVWLHGMTTRRHGVTPTEVQHMQPYLR